MSRGITLIETLISLAIISFGMLAIIAVFPIAAESLDMNYRMNTALFLASSQIENVMSQNYEDLEIGVSTMNLKNYSVETHIDCFNPQKDSCSEEVGMKKIEVIVSPNQSNNEFKLETFITNR